MPNAEQKYFIALVPPEPVCSEIHELKTYIRDKYNSKAALRSPPHITLHMPFLWNEGKEDRLVETLLAFASKQIPIAVSLHEFSCFPPRVIFIGVEENAPLRGLQQSLHRHCKVALNLFNANYREKPFHPHITLAFRDLKKADFAEAWLEFSQRKFQSRFVVEHLSLLKHNGKEWQAYIPLPLGAKP